MIAVQGRYNFVRTGKREPGKWPGLHANFNLYCIGEVDCEGQYTGSEPVGNKKKAALDSKGRFYFGFCMMIGM